MNTHFLDPKANPTEWAFAWAALTRHWGASDEPNDAVGGEVWQYMGTEQSRGTWLHTFRHRMHPRTGRREYWSTPASADFNRAHGFPPSAASWSVSRRAHA